MNLGQTLIGRTNIIYLAVAEVNHSTDIGLREDPTIICLLPPGGFLSSGAGGSASPNGKVWLDTNADGFLKGDEQGMEGVTIELLNAENDSIIQTVVTDSDGNYVFGIINARVTNCYLLISQPQGYMLTKNVSRSCYPTSDYNQKTRKTTVFRTSACPYYASYDAGLVEGIHVLGRKE